MIRNSYSANAIQKTDFMEDIYTTKWLQVLSKECLLKALSTEATALNPSTFKSERRSETLFDIFWHIRIHLPRRGFGLGRGRGRGRGRGLRLLPLNWQIAPVTRSLQFLSSHCLLRFQFVTAQSWLPPQLLGSPRAKYLQTIRYVQHRRTSIVLGISSCQYQRNSYDAAFYAFLNDFHYPTFQKSKQYLRYPTPCQRLQIEWLRWKLTDISMDDRCSTPIGLLA